MRCWVSGFASFLNGKARRGAVFALRPETKGLLVGNFGDLESQVPTSFRLVLEEKDVHGFDDYFDFIVNRQIIEAFSGGAGQIKA